MSNAILYHAVKFNNARRIVIDSYLGTRKVLAEFWARRIGGEIIEIKPQDKETYHVDDIVYAPDAPVVDRPRRRRVRPVEVEE